MNRALAMCEFDRERGRERAGVEEEERARCAHTVRHECLPIALGGCLGGLGTLSASEWGGGGPYTLQSELNVKAGVDVPNPELVLSDWC